MSYADANTAPRSMTKAEQARLLKLTGEHRDEFDDHILFALALGSGLRVFEIEALNCGQVFNKKGGARTTVVLTIFKGHRREGAPKTQEIKIGAALRDKLTRFRKWKRKEKQDVTEDAALFVVRCNGRRMSKRRMSERFESWKLKHCFEGGLSFHSMRHTFCQRIYEQKRDIRLVQTVARHANITTSSIYTHASADDVLAAVNAL